MRTSLKRGAVRVALITLIVLALPPTAVKADVPSVQRFDTELTVGQITVNADQSLSVSGTVASKWYCQEQRPIELFMELEGPDQVVDIGFSSAIGTAWAVRSFPGQADGVNQFYVKAKRVKFKLDRIDGSVDRAICRSEREPTIYSLGL